MTLYRDFIPRRLAPAWLQTPKNAAWLRASGDLKDSLVERCKNAVKARFARLAPRDGLDRIGGERQISRSPAESNSAYAERVANAWGTWRWAGTAYGVLRALRDAGYPGAYIGIVNGLLYSLDPSGLVIEKLPAGSWACDATPEFWSKFVVMFPEPPFCVGLMFQGASTSDPGAIFSFRNSSGGKTNNTGLDLQIVIEILESGIGPSGFCETAWRFSIDGGTSWTTVDDLWGWDTPTPGEQSLAYYGGPDVWFSVSQGAQVESGDRWSTTVPAGNEFVDALDASDPRIIQILRLIDKWKAAHSTLEEVVFLLSGELWGWPIGTWGDPGSTAAARTGRDRRWGWPIGTWGDPSVWGGSTTLHFRP